MRQAEGNESDARTQQESDQGRSLAEWVTFGICLAILVALVGLVTFADFRGEERPPTVEVTPALDAVRHEGDRYYLPVQIRNQGDQTAEDVRVRLSLTSGDGEIESADVTVPFLAGRETARATVVFRKDPAQGSLTYAIGFLEP